MIAFGDRPQSTPKTSPILRSKTCPSNRIRQHEIIDEREKMTPLKTIDYSSFTKITPLPSIDHPKRSKIIFEICENNEKPSLPHVQVLINDPEENIETNQYQNQDEENYPIPHPPPLLALSQAIRRKHPDQLVDNKLIPSLPSKEDLPNSLANYSFVFYQFNSM